MNADRDVTRLVRSWLEEGVEELPDRVRDMVLDALPATPQHRTWWSVWRSQGMSNALKFAIAAAAVLAVAIVGLNFIPRQSGAVGGPNPPSPSPAASPSATPVASAIVHNRSVAGSLEAGRLLRYSVTTPAGSWYPEQDYAVVRGSMEVAILASLVDNTFDDPCAHVERKPKVGSTIEDLVSAFGKIRYVTASAPSQTTFAGHDATRIDLTGPAAMPCAQPYLWQDSPNAYWWLQRGGQLLQVWILEQGGQRVTVSAWTWPDTSVEARAELDSVLDSIKFE